MIPLIWSACHQATPREFVQIKWAHLVEAYYSSQNTVHLSQSKVQGRTNMTSLLNMSNIVRRAIQFTVIRFVRRAPVGWDAGLSKVEPCPLRDVGTSYAARKSVHSTGYNTLTQSCLLVLEPLGEKLAVDNRYMQDTLRNSYFITWPVIARHHSRTDSCISSTLLLPSPSRLWTPLI